MDVEWGMILPPVISVTASIASCIGLVLIGWGKLQEIIQNLIDRVKKLEKKQEVMMGHDEDSAVLKRECGQFRGTCSSHLCFKIDALDKKMDLVEGQRETARVEYREDLKEIYENMREIKDLIIANGNGAKTKGGG